MQEQPAFCRVDHETLDKHFLIIPKLELAAQAFSFYWKIVQLHR